MLRNLLLLFLLILSAPAAAQSRRVEMIAEEQQKKAGALGTEGPGETEQIIRRRQGGRSTLVGLERLP